MSETFKLYGLQIAASAAVPEGRIIFVGGRAVGRRHTLEQMRWALISRRLGMRQTLGMHELTRDRRRRRR